MKLFVSIQLPTQIIYNPFNTNLHENNGDEWGTAFLSVPAQHCDTTWHLSVTVRRCAPNYFYWFICLFIPLIIQCTVKTKTSTPASIWFFWLTIRYNGANLHVACVNEFLALGWWWWGFQAFGLFAIVMCNYYWHKYSESNLF